MFVKAAPGMHVRDPATMRPLPAEGKEVPESSFWVRRLAVGDVLLISEVVIDMPSQIPDTDSAKTEE